MSDNQDRDSPAPDDGRQPHEDQNKEFPLCRSETDATVVNDEDDFAGNESDGETYRNYSENYKRYRQVGTLDGEDPQTAPPDRMIETGSVDDEKPDDYESKPGVSAATGEPENATATASEERDTELAGTLSRAPTLAFLSRASTLALQTEPEQSKGEPDDEATPGSPKED